MAELNAHPKLASSEVSGDKVVWQGEAHKSLVMRMMAG